MEAIIDREIRLDNEKLENQHDPPLQTHCPIPESISTENLKIVSDITPSPNITLLIYLDPNTSKGASGGCAIGYFQMIRNNSKEKDNYKERINKGKKI